MLSTPVEGSEIGKLSIGMESCINTERDIDKLLVKFDGYKKQYEGNLQQLVEQVQKLKEELQQVPPESMIGKSQQAVLSQYNKKIKCSGQKLSGLHKDLHSSVSRIGKTVDRNFDADCSSVIPGVFCNDTKEKILNTTICEHYYRQGQLELAENICKEAQLDIDDSWKQPFVEINEILQSLRHRNIDLALWWALTSRNLDLILHYRADDILHRNHLFFQTENREKLEQKFSSLEFKLHRLKFIEIIRKGEPAQHEALAYSRKFQPFAERHSKEIQMLMGSFLYMKNGVENSPYSYLLDEQNWTDIAEVFMKDACAVMGMSLDSPLMSSFTAGCMALPALIAIKSVIDQRQCSGVLSHKDELPIDIDLDPGHRYHSVFACPILRQQTTENNPPMRLSCGHVISRDALNKLITGSKVKCPYCPLIQAPSDARRVYF